MKKLFIGFLISMFMISQGYCADQWAKTAPLGTSDAADLDSYIGINNEALDRLLTNFRQGCKISYSSASSLSIAAGELVMSNSAGTVRRLRKNTAAISTSWSVATNGLDTGSEAGSTTYYVYGIADTDATTFTILISTNSAAPTGATYYKRLGYFYNDGSSNITQIVNDDNSGDIAFVKGQGNYYKINSGTASLSSGYSTTAVSFSFTFATAPIVVVSDSRSADEHGGSGVDSISTTGFSFYNNRPGGSYTGNWIAIGQVLTQ